MEELGEEEEEVEGDDLTSLAVWQAGRMAVGLVRLLLAPPAAGKPKVGYCSQLTDTHIPLG